MPGLYKDEAIVLRTIKLGEADRIVTLFTRNNGLVRAVAKGIRKTKSRFGGRLEPFTQVDLMVYRGRNLDTITSVHILESFSSIKVDLDRLVSAAALAEAVEKISEERERSFQVYSLLVGGLRALAAGGGATVEPAFLVKLLSVSGYHPQLTVCAGCGSATDLGGFSAAMGGAVCRMCWEEDDGALRLGPDRISLLAHLLASDFGLAAGDPAPARELTHALRRYAEYHLERPLRSLRLPAT